MNLLVLEATGLPECLATLVLEFVPHVIDEAAYLRFLSATREERALLTQLQAVQQQKSEASRTLMDSMAAAGARAIPPTNRCSHFVCLYTRVVHATVTTSMLSEAEHIHSSSSHANPRSVGEIVQVLKRGRSRQMKSLVFRRTLFPRREPWRQL
jgi:hypothetical protein